MGPKLLVFQTCIYQFSWGRSAWTVLRWRPVKAEMGEASVSLAALKRWCVWVGLTTGAPLSASPSRCSHINYYWLLPPSASPGGLFILLFNLRTPPWRENKSLKVSPRSLSAWALCLVWVRARRKTLMSVWVHERGLCFLCQTRHLGCRTLTGQHPWKYELISRHASLGFDMTRQRIESYEWATEMWLHVFCKWRGSRSVLKGYFHVSQPNPCSLDVKLLVYNEVVNIGIWFI